MPKFVESDANPQVPPPYRFPDVNSHAFLFDIPLHYVQAYCDRYLNLGDAKDRGFVYRPYPLFPHAAFIVLEYPAMIPEAQEPPSPGAMQMKDYGFANQNEFLAVFPVIRHGTTPETFLSNMVLEWATPLVVVNNSSSAISGREILGMDKIYGLVDVAEQSVLAGFMGEVCLRAAPTTLSDNTTNMMKFVTIETGPPAPSIGRTANAKSAWSLLGSRQANAALQGLAAAFVGLDDVTGGLIPNPMRIVMLKQIRDTNDADQAVYQALVGARCRYSNVSEIQFYNENDVRLRVRADGPFSALWAPFVGPDNSTPLQEADSSGHGQVREWLELRTRMAVSFKATIDTDDVRELHDFLRPGARPRGMLAPWLRPLAGFLGAANPAAAAPHSAGE